MNAIEKYTIRAEKVNSLLCVGLDPDIQGSQFAFNKKIIEVTHKFAAAYKPNMAFYEARGSEGFEELKLTVDYLKEQYPDILTICDAKRGDIALTSKQYAKAIFDWFGFDAVTLSPYLGRDALQPFLDYKDKGCIVLCRTSNLGAGDFQDLLVFSAALPEFRSGAQSRAVWHMIAETVAKEWNSNGNCMLVAGAIYLEELKTIRGIVGDMPLLVPGIGAQGGDLRGAVQAGINSHGKGLIVNAARSIIFAEDPGQAARSLRDQINDCRSAAQ